MPSPFPGMDPYLERPAGWVDVHHNLISEIRATLNAMLRPKYVIGVEFRGYISDDNDIGRSVMFADIPLDGILHLEVEEAYLAIRETKSESFVAIIEVLSPANKVAGSAVRNSFIAKRREILRSEVHWIEIDLLRAGKPTALNAELGQSDYRIIVSRASNHLRARYWRVGVRQQLPVVGIPLKSKDADIPLDLGAVLKTAYDRACWDATIDYAQPPDPPLKPDDAKWANKLLRAKGLR